MINISTIKNVSHIKKCPKGVIISGDGVGNIMFVILKGEVGIYTSGKYPGAEMVSTLGAGDLFADPGLLLDKKAVYTAVALSEAIILPIERRGVIDFIRDEPSLAYELIKELSLRLDSASTAYKELIVQNNGYQSLHKTKAEGMRRQTSEAATKDDADPDDAVLKDDADPKDDATPKDDVTPQDVTPPAPLSESLAEKKKFMLFPEEHGSYALILDNDPAYLMNKAYTCPICRKSFHALVVRPSKLLPVSTDGDMRTRYKGIEPLYYDVITCPDCLYSALPDVFNNPDKSKQDIQRDLEQLKGSADILFGSEKDAHSVFAGYYLALFCAPVSFVKFQPVSGKLLYKLSRVYQDAGDETLEKLTAKKALDNYLYTYSKISVTPAQEQQYCILIGELYLKQNDLKNALTFFNKAKTMADANRALKNHAENRAYEIRALAAEQK